MKRVYINAIISALSFVGFSLCAMAFFQFTFPLSFLSMFPLSETYYQKAIDAHSVNEKAHWAQRAIEIAPGRAENWMLLAYSYQTQDRGITPRVVSAIRRSIAVSPYSPEAAEYRLMYVYSYWYAMPADVRAAVLEDTNLYAAGAEGIGRHFVCQLVPSIKDDDVKRQVWLICFREDMKSYLAYRRLHPGE